MKISAHWLREFVDPPVSARELGERLTLAGLEVAGIHAAIPSFDGVVVGEVQAAESHPHADKLKICRVTVGAGSVLQIVCGAPNVHAGMKVAVVQAGGRLPDGKVIHASKLRGVESQGMLCSARELGLSDEHTGILELPTDAAVGQALLEVLGGLDSVLEIEMTPNRGDSLSVLGVARDLGAIYDLDVRMPDCASVKPTISERLPLAVNHPRACPVFAGRVIRGLNPQATTPLWITERLRRAGLRSVSVLVDVTQYVMLELGQPMHAYDLAAIHGGLCVRSANTGETLRLLNGADILLLPDMLVIADDSGAVGLAGIMGGQSTAVHAGTRDVFLESACFSPAAIQGRGRRLGLTTDASYRFERGVDPDAQVRALERATRLLQEIAGGKAGPIESAGTGPTPAPRLILHSEKLERLLGIKVPEVEVLRILRRLGFAPEKITSGWQVIPPSYRYDIEIEEDLVEEVGRVYGYENIPASYLAYAGTMAALPEEQVPVGKLREVLISRGYQEIITYSFVDGATQKLLTGTSGCLVANPISDQMTELRTSLWPGLLQTLLYNLNRQQARVRLFEIGNRYSLQANEIKEELCVTGLISGLQFPVQWGISERMSDFADIRSDVEALLAAPGHADNLAAVSASHPGLHPGRSARLQLGGTDLGWVGALHPAAMKHLGLNQPVLLFELTVAPLIWAALPKAVPIPRYPSIQRDLAVVVSEEVSAAQLLTAARAAAGPQLLEVRIFDIYRGEGIDSGRKSVALGLIFQDYSRTLTDLEADALMSRITGQIRRDLGATIRD